MPRKTTVRPGRQAGPRNRPRANPQIDGTNIAARSAASDANPEILGSSSVTPVEPEVSVSIGRMISYIARQIATDILRDGWPASGKRN
jgi:hypothetical protein